MTEAKRPLTITSYVFIAGIEFLMENFSKLVKRHISIRKIFVFHGNCLSGNVVRGDRLMRLHIVLWFCFVGFPFHSLNFMRQRYNFSEFPTFNLFILFHLSVCVFRGGRQVASTSLASDSRAARVLRCIDIPPQQAPRDVRYKAVNPINLQHCPRFLDTSTLPKCQNSLSKPVA